jgi:hypothetical protein
MSDKNIRQYILDEVHAERIYQGTNAEDVKNGPFEWIAYITHHATRWFPGGFPPYSESTLKTFRKQMITVAALAVAAVEQFDRQHPDLKH